MRPDGATPPRPAGPPWRLNALALLGTLGYQFIVLAPVALLLAIACLQFRAGWAWWLGGAMLLGVWWLTQGGGAPEGTEVSREEAPALWAMLDELADRMRVPRLARVVLTHESGAAAIEHQDAWLPWRHHRTLSLGMPLLAGMGADEMRAVVAHELGHFSRHFGWSGHWLYRARIGWAQLLAARNDETVWYRAASAYAGWFVPYFERHSATQAVGNEYEADALAAEATSANALARALARLAVADLREPAPFGDGALPADPMRHLLPGLRDAVDATMLETALQRQAAWHALQDPVQITHPPTRERLRAVGLSAARLDVSGVPEDQTAGSVWWQAGWTTRLAEENTRWQRQHARRWRNQACWRAACAERQGHPSETEDADALECVLALGQRPDASALPEEPDGRPPLAAYWVGATWLATDPARALRWFEAAIPACVALAAPARRLVLEAAVDGLAPRERERQQQLLDQALQRRDDARVRAEALGLVAGKAVKADAWRRTALTEALAEDTAVEHAAWVEHEITLASGREYTVVSLCLQVALDGGTPETGVAQDYAHLLAQVVTPMRVGWVRTWWSTEDWPAALETPIDGGDSPVLKARA
jgi:Zn-dependent protease with chaperone function